MRMAVSVFKEWVVHHCSSCGDIFCLKFNLHLFQRCHKNAYKEQAHDLDVAPFPTYHCSLPRTVQMSRRQIPGLLQQRRKGLSLPTCWRASWEGYLFSPVHHGISPSPKSADGDHHMMRTLWGIQCLLGQCWSPPYLDHLPVKACCPDGKCWESRVGAARRGWDTCKVQLPKHMGFSVDTITQGTGTQRQPNSCMYQLQRWSSPMFQHWKSGVLNTTIMVLHLSEE